MKKKKNEHRLIESLYKQLQESGNFVEVTVGFFDDGSASWIDCYHTLQPDKKSKRYVKHLSFNGSFSIE